MSHAARALVVDPKNSLRTPVSPCVLMTIDRRSLPGNAQDLRRRLAYRDDVHIQPGRNCRIRAERAASESLHFCGGVLGSPEDPGAEVRRFGQERIFNREHDEQLCRNGPQSTRHIGARRRRNQKNQSGKVLRVRRSSRPPG